MKNKRVTQKQIADKLGISRSTVSYVLAGRAKDLRIAPKTVEKIFSLAGKEGYVPNAMARGLSQRRSHTIGIVVDYLFENIAHHIHMGMIHTLWRQGLQPIWVTRDRQPRYEEAMLRWLLERCVDAIGVYLPMVENLDLYRNIEKQGTPVLFLGDVPLGMPDAHYVVWDSREPVRRLVRHLAQQGCTRIGYFGHAEGNFLLAGTYQAYRETLMEEGLVWNPEWTFQALARDYSRSVLFTKEAENLHPWVEGVFQDKGPEQRPDAFICGDDFMGVSLSQHLQNIGLAVPEDVALAGRNNYPVNMNGHYGMTTAIAPYVTMGRTAVDVFLELMDSPRMDPAQKRIHCDEIFVRPSSLKIMDTPLVESREESLMQIPGSITSGTPLDWNDLNPELTSPESRSSIEI